MEKCEEEFPLNQFFHSIIQVGKFIQLMSTFMGGFIVAFIEGWLLTLVMLSSIPPLALSGAILSIVITKMATRGQTAYSEAGVIVEQTIGSIRTVHELYFDIIQTGTKKL